METKMPLSKRQKENLDNILLSLQGKMNQIDDAIFRVKDNEVCNLLKEYKAILQKEYDSQCYETVRYADENGKIREIYY